MSPLVLGGVEIGNGMSEEALAVRRVVFLERLEALNASGWEIKRPKGRKFHKPPKPPREPRPASEPKPKKVGRPRGPVLSEEERKRRAREQKAAWKARVVREVELGLREAPVRKKRGRTCSASKAQFSLPVGSWITWKSRGGKEMVGQVLAHVPVGVVPVIPEGCHTKKTRATVAPCRFPRYTVATPGLDDLAHPVIVLPFASEVEGNLITIHDGLPKIERLWTPLPAGTHVRWTAKGAGNHRDQEGIVNGYIPAGSSVEALFPGVFKKCPSDGTVDTSIRDRYLIVGTQRRRVRDGWHLPAAYVIEMQAEIVEQAS